MHYTCENRMYELQAGIRTDQQCCHCYNHDNCNHFPVRIWDDKDGRNPAR